MTSAPFVVFLDADDRLLPGALDIGVASLRLHPGAAFTSGASRLITEDGSPIGGELPQPSRGDLYSRLLRRVYICPPSTVMFRRAALAGAGAWSDDPDIWGCEDWEVYLRLARAHPIVCHGATVADYRIHPGQTSRQTSRMQASIFTLLRREADYTLADRRRERARRAALRYWSVRLRYTLAREDLVAARSAKASRRVVARAAASATLWYVPSLLYWLPESRPGRMLQKLLSLSR